MKIGLPLIISGSVILILSVVLTFTLKNNLTNIILPIGISIFTILLVIGIIYSSKDNYKKSNLTCDVIVPCIPTHVKFLEEFVNDIKNQTRQPNRIIIALSQTNEKESKQLEKSLNKILNKVSVISTEKIQKSWDNRDRGAVYSDADVYCFLDADDRVHPQRIEAAMEKFEKKDVKFLLCEGSSDSSILTKRYNKDTFTYITGQKIYDKEIEKLGKFPIEIRHFDVDIDYNTGVIFIDSKVWWSIGGQTNISMKSNAVLENNGVGEDIVFVRTIIDNMADKSKFIIIRNPLLVKRASSSRKETHWQKDPSISENKTLPHIAKLIKKRVK
jgi:glycosyltransferase involved in cell wall biosynthesis